MLVDSNVDKSDVEQSIIEHRTKLQQIDKLLMEATEEDNEARQKELVELKKELKENLIQK